MRARPQCLFVLFEELTNLAGIGPKTATALKKRGIETPADLLFHLPDRLIARQQVQTVLKLHLPAMITLRVRVIAHHRNTRKTSPYRITVEDAQTQFQLVFFHPNVNWLMRHFAHDQQIYISGRLEEFDGLPQMVHPDYVAQTPDTIPSLETHYPAGQGITQKTLRRALDDLLTKLPDLPEWIAPDLLKEHEWPDWATALAQLHHPTSYDSDLPQIAAYRRLAFDELLAHQLTLAIARQQRQKNKSKKGQRGKGQGVLRQNLLKSLPYTPTKAQTRAIDEIVTDLKAPPLMYRLLQGDVGAGKTLVALASILETVEAGGQCALLVPTDVLAQQHYRSIQALCDPLDVAVVLLSAQIPTAQYRQAHEDIKSGKAAIAIGTHALFQNDVVFKNLRLGVIDEQQRFGVQERQALAVKGKDVDLLVMSATPIPRTLELAQYGDMDVTILDEKPPGRQQINTAIISADRLDAVVQKLRDALQNGQQAYWICPLVEESEKLDLTSVQKRYEALCAALPCDQITLVHGRLSAQEKGERMARFADGDAKLLVATTAIEVGVDVPNATIMIIEQAERFGLSQLHQLRGRVGRGRAQSTCVLLYQTPLGQTARMRLQTIRNSNDGFAIAEADLKLRGAGDVLGLLQAGIPKFKMADLSYHGDLMKIAHHYARLIMYENPDLSGAQGAALQTLLHLMRYEEAILRLRQG